MGDRENHEHCTGQFVELANKLKDDGFDINLISAALMAASGIYATYTAAGNSGALEESGIEKVAAQYRRNLEHIQKSKKAELSGDQEVTGSV